VYYHSDIASLCHAYKKQCHITGLLIPINYLPDSVQRGLI